MTPNPNEVASCRYVSQRELRDLLAEGEAGRIEVTPWFKIVCDSFLFRWWDSLDDLSSFVDTKTIHRMKD